MRKERISAQGKRIAFVIVLLAALTGFLSFLLLSPRLSPRLGSEKSGEGLGKFLSPTPLEIANADRIFNRFCNSTFPRSGVSQHRRSARTLPFRGGLCSSDPNVFCTSASKMTLLLGALPKASAFVSVGALSRVHMAPTTVIACSSLGRYRAGTTPRTARTSFIRYLTGGSSTRFASGTGLTMQASGKVSPKHVLVPVADGSEEIESVTIIDTLVRAGASVTVASVSENTQVRLDRNIVGVISRWSEPRTERRPLAACISLSRGGSASCDICSCVLSGFFLKLDLLNRTKQVR